MVVIELLLKGKGRKMRDGLIFNIYFGDEFLFHTLICCLIVGSFVVKEDTSFSLGYTPHCAAEISARRGTAGVCLPEKLNPALKAIVFKFNYINAPKFCSILRYCTDLQDLTTESNPEIALNVIICLIMPQIKKCANYSL